MGTGTNVFSAIVTGLLLGACVVLEDTVTGTGSWSAQGVSDLEREKGF